MKHFLVNGGLQLEGPLPLQCRFHPPMMGVNKLTSSPQLVYSACSIQCAKFRYEEKLDKNGKETGRGIVRLDCGAVQTVYEVEEISSPTTLATN